MLQLADYIIFLKVEKGCDLLKAKHVLEKPVGDIATLMSSLDWHLSARVVDEDVHDCARYDVVVVYHVKWL